MATSRRIFALISLIIAIFALAATPALSVDGAKPDGGKVGGPERPEVSELPGGWHLVRTHNPNGGTDAISIMHPADTSRSDLDFVGLIIRCGETSPEVVIVLLPALSFHTRPHITFGKPGNEIHYEAKVMPPGTTVVLPGDAAQLVSGPWRALEDLFVRIDDGQTTIGGVVKLAGLEAAFKALQASCAAR
jgi:hypothetical protein